MVFPGPLVCQVEKYLTPAKSAVKRAARDAVQGSPGKTIKMVPGSRWWCV